MSRQPRRSQRKDPVQIWRPEIPPEDTAPGLRLPVPDPNDWGVTPEGARDLLLRQTCPICGEGPWQSVLNHVSRKHAIRRQIMRDVCLLSTRDKVTDGELREKFRANGNANVATLLANATSWDRRTARRTKRAVANDVKLIEWAEAHPEEMAALRAGFRERMNTPAARAASQKAMRKAAAERVVTDEQRAAFRDRMSNPEVAAKRQAKIEATRIETCTIDGCERQHAARGYCNMHWRRWRNTGNAGPAQRVAPAYRTGCQVEGCQRKHWIKGYCRLHHERVQRDGAPGPAAPLRRQSVSA